eukprot:Rmarinus@m.29741
MLLRFICVYPGFNGVTKDGDCAVRALPVTESLWAFYDYVRDRVTNRNVETVAAKRSQGRISQSGIWEDIYRSQLTSWAAKKIAECVRIARCLLEDGRSEVLMDSSVATCRHVAFSSEDPFFRFVPY